MSAPTAQCLYKRVPALEAANCIPVRRQALACPRRRLLAHACEYLCACGCVPLCLLVHRAHVDLCAHVCAVVHGPACSDTCWVSHVRMRGCECVCPKLLRCTQVNMCVVCASQLVCFEAEPFLFRAPARVGMCAHVRFARLCSCRGCMHVPA
jgi:hypothetical protein